ncbi:MAG: sulfite exporter TauE/SafE family protein [Actinomycetota bacterium]|nr:sulfite exporter TauE/SafE family protein [Actinomycetota bacterium]
MIDILLAIAFGVAGGFIGGLVGVGGGILFVPALAIFLDEPQVRAEATSLLAIIIVALVGTWRQRGYGNVRLQDAGSIGLLSIGGVAIGVVVANQVSERALEIAFAILATGIAVELVVRASRPASS